MRLVRSGVEQPASQLSQEAKSTSGACDPHFRRLLRCIWNLWDALEGHTSRFSLLAYSSERGASWYRHSVEVEHLLLWTHWGHLRISGGPKRLGAGHEAEMTTGTQCRDCHSPCGSSPKAHFRPRRGTEKRRSRSTNKGAELFA